MVIQSHYSFAFKYLGNVVGILAVAGVHYGRTVQAVENMQKLICLVFGAPNHVCEVLAFETHAENVRAAEQQLVLYVGGHFFGGCSCKGKHGNVREELAHLGNLEIRRTEVVAPLRYAVGLVDSNKSNRDFYGFRYKKLRRKPFGRHVKEFVVAENTVFKICYDFTARHAVIHGGGLYAFGAEVGHLVFHQRYQRRDDKAQAVACKRGHLERNRLAPARGHKA